MVNGVYACTILFCATKVLLSIRITLLSECCKIKNSIHKIIYIITIIYFQIIGLQRHGIFFESN